MNESELEKKLAGRLKRLRIEKGDSLQTLANKMEMSKQSVRNYESPDSDYATSNCTSMPVRKLVQFADYFGCSLDYLTGRTDCKSPQEDIRTACQTTGLSENAVNKLQAFTRVASYRKYADGLELLINSQYFAGLLLQIANIQNKAAEYNRLNTIHESDNYKVALESENPVKVAGTDMYPDEIANALCYAEEPLEVAKYRAQAALEKIMNEIAEKGTEQNGKR